MHLKSSLGALTHGVECDATKPKVSSRLFSTSCDGPTIPHGLLHALFTRLHFPGKIQWNWRSKIFAAVSISIFAAFAAKATVSAGF
jgi:hypothetical protein